MSFNQLEHVGVIINTITKTQYVCIYMNMFTTASIQVRQTQAWRDNKIEIATVITPW